MAYLLQRLLTEAAARQPQRPAVASGGCLLTYRELDRLSNKVARVLLRLGVAPGDRVGILAPKSAAAVIGIYGVLKAGACYVPLDPKAPAGRLSHIVADSGAAVIVADEARTSQAAALAGAVPRPPGVVVAGVPGRPEREEAASAPAPGRGHCAVDRGGGGIRGAAGGGTGDRDRPGVHLVHVGIDRHPEGGDDLPPQLAHVCRVGGGRCGARRAGPRLQPRAAALRPVGLRHLRRLRGGRVPDGASRRGGHLPGIDREVAGSRADLGLVLGALGPHAAGLLRQPGPVRPVGPADGDLRRGGVPPQAPRPADGRAAAPPLPELVRADRDQRVTAFEVPAGGAGDRPAPIGKACANTEVFAVTSEGRRVSRPGEEGELYVRGPSLMRGYWGQPAKTSEALVPEPVPGRVRRAGVPDR